jgi:hypothetical protein
MSSENRAANALGRHYPGGLQAFVAAMNRKALSLGMTRYAVLKTPTGLNSNNVSTAHDLGTDGCCCASLSLDSRVFDDPWSASSKSRGRDLDFPQYQSVGQQSDLGDWAVEDRLHSGSGQVSGHAGAALPTSRWSLCCLTRRASRPALVMPIASSAGWKVRLSRPVRLPTPVWVSSFGPSTSHGAPWLFFVQLFLAALGDGTNGRTH